MKKVNQAIPKIDAKALVTGKPVYTDDLAPKDCLIVKVLRSPHAHALIRNIDSSRARKVPGIVSTHMRTVRRSDSRWQDRRIRSQVLMTD